MTEGKLKMQALKIGRGGKTRLVPSPKNRVDLSRELEKRRALGMS